MLVYNKGAKKVDMERLKKKDNIKTLKRYKKRHSQKERKNLISLFHLPQLLPDKIDNGAMFVSVSHINKVGNRERKANGKYRQENDPKCLGFHSAPHI